jgi:UrcA family protein
MKRATTLVLTAALVAGATIADASTMDDAMHVTVRYSDLDLTRVQGASVLYRRLHRAAEIVCASSDGQGIQRAVGYRTCVAESLSRAVVHVDQPILSAYHQTQIDARKPAPIRIALEQ